MKSILNVQTKSINSAALILGAASLASAFLGLLRDRLLAHQFGAGDELDIYYAAFKVPDFIALILIMGAISAAVVPIFSQYLVRSREEAWDFVASLLNVFLVFLISVSALMVVIAPFLISLVAPGFQGEKRELTILLTRIMFLSPIILGVSNIISGVLQVFRRFLATSLAPIFYNIGIIFGILFFVPKVGVVGLAFGVVLGAVLHFLIQLPVFLFSGFRYKAVFNFFHEGVKKAVVLTVPRSLGLAASQINLIIVTAIASTLAAGSIAVFNLANNIIFILINLIAVPFSTAVFPILSMRISENNKSEFLDKFYSTFRQILFFMVPASFLFFALRNQIVVIILGSGKFNVADIQLVAVCLGLFSLGVFAQGLVLLISKAFYAAQNTKTPAVVSVVAVIANVFLSLIFIDLLRSSSGFRELITNLFSLEGLNGVEVVALPLAISFSAIFQCFLLLALLHKKIGDFRLREASRFFIKIILISILMTVFIYFALEMIPIYFRLDTANLFGVFWQTVLSSMIGILIYLGLAFALRLPEAQIIGRIIRRTGQD